MTLSAAGLGAMGTGLMFAPETLGPALLGLGESGGVSPLAAQLFGTCLVGFALLDWAGRGAIYGGIYGRPITLANFFVGFSLAATLVQVADGPLQWAVVAGFAAQSFAFGRLLFSGLSPVGSDAAPPIDEAPPPAGPER